jgi:hypothetical protein
LVTARQSKDKGECHQWAVNNTGVDPAQFVTENNSGDVYQRHHSAIVVAEGVFRGGVQNRRDLERQRQVIASVHADQQAQLKSLIGPPAPV